MEASKPSISWIFSGDAIEKAVASAGATASNTTGSAAKAGELLTTDVTIEGYAQPIALRLYRPVDASGLPIVLYFHGGGFIRGTLDDADVAARYLASVTPALVVSVGYSLAPKFPFPAAPEDAHRAAL